jgi:thiol-disulfide isomerase/thioredoxin
MLQTTALAALLLGSAPGVPAVPALLAASPTAPATVSQQNAHVPPEAGSVAKPLGTVYWYDLGDAPSKPSLLDMRGEVVLVHTWGYYCGPCMKAGVPNVADVVRANKERGLRAVSITVLVGDDKPDDHFVKVGREKGLEHPLGVADGFGEMSPYVNLNEAKALTWCFVIGREGGVRWVGNPSRDEEEFLEAVRLAIAEEPLPLLPASVPEDYAKGIASYVAGDLGSAREALAKRAARLEGKDDEAAAVGRALVDAIDEHHRALSESLDSAVSARDAEAFVVTRRTLLARFGKAGAKKLVQSRERSLREDPELAAAIEAWTTWDTLRFERPALFPERADDASKRYAKDLRSFLKKAEEGAPGVGEAQALLAAYEGAAD